MVRFSEYFVKTLKEDPSSSEIPSYTLCLRAGLIKKIASGIYTFLPPGYRVLKKIEDIVREEMNKTGAHEILMPAIQPADLWVQSERWFQYGPELFRFKDRNKRDFCLGPTHEEIMTHIAHLNIKSYKELPVNLYQIQVKFRDEIRPRYGILRAREFIMKDAYSFSANEDELDDIYNKMYECYCKILERLGLNYFVVEADTGIIGGKFSHEFIISADNGEELVVYCEGCGYAAKYEMSVFKNSEIKKTSSIDEDPQPGKKIVYTPKISSIKSLTDFLKVPVDSILKTLILSDKEKNLYAVLLTGERDLNLQKLEKHIGKELVLLEKNDDTQNLNIGFVGPVGLNSKIKVYADNSIKNKKNFISGANKKNYHYINVNRPRDFKVDSWGDFTFPLKGDICAKCGSELQFKKGIEVGHIFKLGTKYSEKMGALFLDSKGESKPIIMGCYGFGVSRVLAASIEQLFDKNGIVWPDAIAPFIVNIISTNMADKEIIKSAEDIYERIKNEDIEVVYDDREVRAGVKFKDADLMGIPIKLIVGKNFIGKGKVEIEIRKDNTRLSMDLDSAVKFIREYNDSKVN